MPVNPPPDTTGGGTPESWYSCGPAASGGAGQVLPASRFELVEPDEEKNKNIKNMKILK